MKNRTVYQVVKDIVFLLDYKGFERLLQEGETKPEGFETCGKQEFCGGR